MLGSKHRVFCLILCRNLENLIFYGRFVIKGYNHSYTFGLSLSQYRILCIVPQTLSESEEFPEVQCCYFASEKEFTPLFSSWKFVEMIILSDVGRNGFYSVSQPCQTAELITLHISLAFCPVWGIFWGNKGSHFFIYLRMALILIWTAGTMIPVK